MTRFSLIPTVLACALLLGCQTAEQQAQEALAMSVQDYKERLILKDDEFERVVKISSEDAFIPRYGLLGVPGSDSFVRVLIDKPTGEKLYQVYVAMVHREANWAHPLPGELW